MQNQIFYFQIQNKIRLIFLNIGVRLNIVTCEQGFKLRNRVKESQRRKIKFPASTVLLKFLLPVPSVQKYINNAFLCTIYRVNLVFKFTDITAEILSKSIIMIISATIRFSF